MVVGSLQVPGEAEQLGEEQPAIGARIALADADAWSAIAGVPYGWRARSTSVKDQLRTTRSAVSDGAKTQVTRVNESMRTKPMLWAGIAAGAGFSLGLVGRIAQWRSKQQQGMPDLVIIESRC